MAAALTLQTALSRAECSDRLEARLDRRSLVRRIDLTRPVRGRSSIEGFVIRHPRDPIVEAVGTYLLGAQGGTRIEVRHRLPWRRQLWWMAVNVALLGLFGGVTLAGSVLRGVAADPLAAVLVSTLVMAVLVALLQVALIGLAWLVYGGRQRDYLRRVIEETLVAR